MRAGVHLPLAVCGGGNNALAVIIVLLGLAIWLLAVRLSLARVTDRAERTRLSLFMAGSAVLGSAIFLVPDLFPRGDYATPALVALLVPPAVGAVLATRSDALSVARVASICLAGAVLLPGLLFLIFFASLFVGGGCLA